MDMFEGQCGRSLWGPQFRGRRSGTSPSSQPEQMGFMFHSVCMKEASTWSSPLAVDRCWGQQGCGSQRRWRVSHSPGSEARNQRKPADRRQKIRDHRSGNQDQTGKWGTEDQKWMSEVRKLGTRSLANQ